MEIRVYETAICFARMWGVLETLEPLPNLGFEEVRNISLALAEEFIAGKGDDMVSFFVEKSKNFTQKYSKY